VFEDIGGHDGSGHGRSGDLSKTCKESQITSSYALVIDVLLIDVQAAHRCNDVRFDVVLDTLLGQGHGKSDQTGYYQSKHTRSVGRFDHQGQILLRGETYLYRPNS
jgi:hypothetical protein